MTLFTFVQDNTITADRTSIKIDRLTKKEVEEKRKIRLKEIEMWSYIRQLLIYSFYLCTLYTISYANRNSNSYQHVQHLKNFFLGSTNSSFNYAKVFFS